LIFHVALRRGVFADLANRTVLAFVEFTGSAVEVRVNRLCLAASDSSASTCLWSKLYFRRSQARARSEEWLIHAERGRTICSFVTRPGGRCHGHAQPKLPYAVLSPSLIAPAVLLASNLRPVFCKRCRRCSRPPSNSRLLHVLLSLVFVAGKFDLSSEILPQNHVLRMSTSPAASELQATSSRPTQPCRQWSSSKS
jgi:hypothetical protein